jgi:peptidyl-prolyl cis-trans isomerase D
MLQRIRDGLQGQKWLAWVILGAIGATFVFWGGSNSLDFTGVGSNSAAEVNGEEIPAAEAQQAWQETQQNFSEQFATEVPEAQRVAMQARLVDNMVLRKVIEQRLRNEHFRVSDEAIYAEWRSIPAFQTDGKYDPSKAQILLQQNNRTEHQFRAETRENMLFTQLQKGIGASYFLLPGERDRLATLENEEREVEYALLPTSKYASTAPLDEAAVKAYYDKNNDRFMTNEYAKVQFAELRLEALASQVTPTDADLQKLYDENSARYVREETRHARQVLIGVDEGGDDAAALKKAEAIAAEARAGKDFAELARKNSTDLTAANGGLLDPVTKAQFPGPMGDTLFSMKVGDVSAPVKSQYGYHIFKLESIEAKQAQPFADVRAELDSQYRQEKAAELFGERQDQIQAALEKGVTDIDKLATDLGLTRGTIDNFLRGGGGEPLGSGPDLQAAVFGDEALNQGKIAGPVELGEDRLVLVKVTEHHKAAVKPLAEVRAEIEGILQQERAVTAAKAAAEEALKRLQGGETLAEVAKSLGVTGEPVRFIGRADPSVPAALRSAVFDAARPTDKPIIKLATLDDGTSALVVVSRSRTADNSANPALAEQQKQSLMQRAAQGDVAAYVNEVRAQAKVVKNPKLFSDQ